MLMLEQTVYASVRISQLVVKRKSTDTKSILHWTLVRGETEQNLTVTRVEKDRTMPTPFTGLAM